TRSKRDWSSDVCSSDLPRSRHTSHRLQAGDSVEIVTLVGGGEMNMLDDPLRDDLLVLGAHRFRSRLITGTGKYANFELMRQALRSEERRVGKEGSARRA